MFRHLLCPVTTALALVFLHLDRGVHAQEETIQNILWNTPDGDLVDLSQTFTAGTTIGLSWNAYNSTSYVDTTENLVYLWVSSFDYNTNPYSKLLKTNINMTQPGNFAWTIEIPEEILANSAKYVLRFKLPVSEFDFGSGELSSPGFLVLRSTASSTPTFSATTSSTSTSATPVTAVTTQSTTPSPVLPADTTRSEGLSGGAKAGIGIGAALLALTVAAAVWFFIFRKKKDTKSEETIIDHGLYEPGYSGQKQQVYSPVAAVELSAPMSKNGWHASELPTHPH